MRHVPWVVWAVVLFASSARAQTDDELAEAREHFAEASAAYEAREYTEAGEHFAEAHELTNAPELAFNAARSFERAGRREDAIRFYRIYLRDADASTTERTELEGLIAALERGGEPEDSDDSSSETRALRRAPSLTEGLAQRFAPRFEEVARVSVLATFGLGGGVRFAADPDLPGILLTPDGRSDLEPTYGAAVRGEVFLARYLGVGLELGLASYSAEESDDRELTVDVDLWLRPRLPVVLSASLELELYVGIPIGFTLYRPSDEDLENLLGFNAGVLGGVSLAVHERIAFFVEVGWRHRQVYDELTILQKHELTLRTDQAHLGIGASLRL